MTRFLTFLTILLLAAPAAAWNDKGHMVVARLAWKELKPEERAKVIEMLKSHPHYQEFLTANRPDNIPEDEWAFMRAATWADWIRGGPPARKAYHQGPWHYVNVPFVAAGSKVKPPGEGDENIIKQIDLSKKAVMTATSREDRAVHVTWVFHLIGDIQQPLHNITRFSDDLPDGDRGGNESAVMLNGKQVRLHTMWDNLLGTEVSLASISKSVLEIEETIKDKPKNTAEELEKHTTPRSWSEEAHDLGFKIAYLNGELKVKKYNEKAGEGTPDAPENYAKNAGEVARYQVYKGGKRLAAYLREMIGKN
ncbi:S1/P1 nuclease [Zavarzinella formosa]|uniref:S1/P1 nuclease n=1 Tax=Zavarzinella formosa TaxID=360055 RepID=UPI00031D491C|nr:S1/P1 nuclease [Zavarzinella formosa]